MTRLHCPNCRSAWSGEYDTHHRCAECHTPLLAESQGHLLEELEAQIEDLTAERDRFRAQVKAARDYAGERCAAQEGLTVVSMLERALGGGK